MDKLLIEPHFLGSSEYFGLIVNAKEVCFEVCDTFPKQTYRNRAYLLGSNKTLPLIVPLKYSSGTATKNVKIDYSQRWVKDHWGAFSSSYGNAPFYQYFADEFKALWETKFKYLVDLDLEMFELVLTILKVNVDVSYTENYRKGYDIDVSDFRNTIHPKKPFSDRKMYAPKPYTQLFGDCFVPNLSIVDAIMCEGGLARDFC